MTGSSLNISVQELRGAGVTPLPKDVLVHEMVDSSGDDALEAILVFPNNASDDQLRWKNIRQLEEAVRQLLRARDSRGRFIYVRARRTKELTASDRA